MTATPLTLSGFSKWQATEPATASACFQPLDPGLISASIPTFFVGRDRGGFWLARDVKGENGGIFLFRDSALAFARHAAAPFGCAIILLPERFELDVENQGNPLIGFLRPLLRFVIAAR